MQYDPNSMMRNRIANIAQNAIAANRRKDMVRHEQVFKEKSPVYTVGDFLQDVVACGETYESMMEHLNPYARREAMEIIEQSCILADLLDEMEITCDSILTEAKLEKPFRDRATKDIVALRNIRDLRKSRSDISKSGSPEEKTAAKKEYQDAKKAYLAPKERDTFGRRGTEVKPGFLNWITGKYRPDRKRIEKATYDFLTTPLGQGKVIRPVLAKGVAAASQVPSDVRAALTKKSEAKPAAAAAKPAAADEYNTKTALTRDQRIARVNRLRAAGKARRAEYDAKINTVRPGSAGVVTPSGKVVDPNSPEAQVKNWSTSTSSPYTTSITSTNMPTAPAAKPVAKKDEYYTEPSAAKPVAKKDEYYTEPSKAEPKVGFSSPAKFGAVPPLTGAVAPRRARATLTPSTPAKTEPPTDTKAAIAKVQELRKQKSEARGQKKFAGNVAKQAIEVLKTQTATPVDPRARIRQGMEFLRNPSGKIVVPTTLIGGKKPQNPKRIKGKAQDDVSLFGRN